MGGCVVFLVSSDKNICVLGMNERGKRKASCVGVALHNFFCPHGTCADFLFSGCCDGQGGIYNNIINKNTAAT